MYESKSKRQPVSAVVSSGVAARTCYFVDNRSMTVVQAKMLRALTGEHAFCIQAKWQNAGHPGGAVYENREEKKLFFADTSELLTQEDNLLHRMEGEELRILQTQIERDVSVPVVASQIAPADLIREDYNMDRDIEYMETLIKRKTELLAKISRIDGLKPPVRQKGEIHIDESSLQYITEFLESGDWVVRICDSYCELKGALASYDPAAPDSPSPETIEGDMSVLVEKAKGLMIPDLKQLSELFTVARSVLVDASILAKGDNQAKFAAFLNFVSDHLTEYCTHIEREVERVWALYKYKGDEIEETLRVRNQIDGPPMTSGEELLTYKETRADELPPRDVFRYYGIMQLPGNKRMSGVFPLSDMVEINSHNVGERNQLLREKAKELIEKLKLYNGTIDKDKIGFLSGRFGNGCVCIMFIKSGSTSRGDGIAKYRPTFGVSGMGIKSSTVARGQVNTQEKVDMEEIEANDYSDMGFTEFDRKLPREYILERQLNSCAMTGIRRPSKQAQNYLMQVAGDGIENWMPTNCAEPAIIMALSQLLPKTIDIALSVPFEVRLHKGKLVGKCTCGRCAVSEPAFIPAGYFLPEGERVSDVSAEKEIVHTMRTCPAKPLPVAALMDKKLFRYTKTESMMRDFESKFRIPFPVSTKAAHDSDSDDDNDGY